MNALVKWDPFRELEEFSNRLASTFHRSRNGDREDGNRLWPQSQWTPVVDIVENDQEYVVTAELPGIDKKDVNIKVEDGLLVISGERKGEREEQKGRVHRVERFYGHFSRAFSLPEEVESDKIRAEFKNGELVLRLPKSEKARPKAIDIKID